MIDDDSAFGIEPQKTNEEVGDSLRDRMKDLRIRNEQLQVAMDQTRLDVIVNENANKKS